MILAYNNESIKSDKIVSIIESNGNLIFKDVNGFEISIKHGIRGEVALRLAQELIEKSNINGIVNLECLTRNKIESLKHSNKRFVYNNDLRSALIEIRSEYERIKMLDSGQDDDICPISSHVLYLHDKRFNIGLIDIINIDIIKVYYSHNHGVRCNVSIPFNSFNGFKEFDIEYNHIKTLNDVLDYILGDKELK